MSRVATSGVASPANRGNEEVDTNLRSCGAWVELSHGTIPSK